MGSGASAVIASSCVADQGGRIVLDIVTPEASFSIEDGRLSVTEDSTKTIYMPKVDMYAEENKVFIEAVRTGKKNKIRSSFSDALKSFLVTYAANESIETGLPIKV